MTMTDSLECATGDLVLRIRGTSRDGQVLRLRARKCTIGSGQQCILRLNARHVAPLHCLILRGGHGTVVRSWTADTRLNGKTFSDAMLAPGDRLGIGLLDFEVVALNDTGKAAPGDLHKDNPPSVESAPAAAEKDFPNEASRDLDALRESLIAERGAIDLRNFQLNEEVAALEKEKECLEREKSQFSEERNSFLACQSELAAEKEGLNSQRTALQADREAVAKEKKVLQAEYEAIEKNKKDLQAERDAFAGERKSGRDSSEILNEGQKKLQAEREAIAEERKALQKAKEAFAESQASWQAVQEAFYAEQTALEQNRKAFGEEQETFQAKREAAEKQLADRERKIHECEKELETKTASLADDVVQSESFGLEIDRLHQELDEQKQRADAQAAEMEQRASRFAVECEKREKQNRGREEEFVRRGQEADAREEMLNRRDEEIRNAMEQLQRERMEFEADCRRKEAELTALAKANAEFPKDEARECAEEPEKTQDRNADAAQPPESSPRQKKEVDLQEILNRLGHKVDFSDDDAAEAQSSPADASRTEANSPPSPSKPAQEEEEEESIDSYMSQLMKRLGVNQSPAANVRNSTETAAPRQPAKPAERADSVEDKQQPSDNAVKRRKPAEMSPRAEAPEKNVDMSAFRDLANLSAKQALGQHDIKRLKSESRMKAVLACLGLAVGAGLLWHWYAHDPGQWVLIAAALCFVIAFYKGMQYAILIGRLIVHNPKRLVHERMHENRNQAAECGGKAENGSPEGVDSSG
jgi:chromosome segregation ATPase